MVWDQSPKLRTKTEERRVNWRDGVRLLDGQQRRLAPPWRSGVYSLASVRFDVVEEASVSVFGANEADPVQGGVVQPKLVRLHLRTQTLCSNQPIVSPSAGTSGRYRDTDGPDKLLHFQTL